MVTLFHNQERNSNRYCYYKSCKDSKTWMALYSLGKFEKMKLFLCLMMHFKNAALMWLTLLSYSLWGVTDKSMESDNIWKLHHAHALASLCEFLHPNLPRWGLPKNPTFYFLHAQVILFGSIFASRWFACFIICLKVWILSFYLAIVICLHFNLFCFYLSEQQSLELFRKVGSDNFYTSFCVPGLIALSRELYPGAWLASLQVHCLSTYLLVPRKQLKLLV